jgi:hypothetical protein
VKFRRLNADLHRDIGYFLSGLILVYCISGIALNHVNDWNPDFVIHKRTITLDQTYTRDEVTDQRLAEFTALVGESPPKVHDFPTPDQVKLYFDNASLLVDLAAKTGTYERVQRRPLIYETNVLHRNSLKGWKWASDLFSVLLIFLTVSGWFMLKGRHGVIGRGKWFIAAGMVPPIVAIFLFELVQK